MIELLRIVVPFLIVAILAVVVGILVREGWVTWERRRWQRQRSRCLALLGELDMVTMDELLPLAIKLKRSFPSTIVESVLDEFCVRDNPQPIRQKIAEIYEYVGFVEKHIGHLQDSKAWQDRATSAEKLGNIGHARAVLPLIATLLDAKEDQEVKNVAMRALGSIRDPRSIPPLIESLGLPDPSTGQPLADVLIRYGEMIVDPLTEILGSSPREMQRFWAARIFGALRLQKPVPKLLLVLSDHSPRVRAEAIAAIGSIGTHEGVAPLSKILLEDPVALVREAAAEALGKIADDRALDTLKQSLSDVDVATRRRAMEALERMGERAVPFFLSALSGQSDEAAIQAANALERLGWVSRWVENLAGSEWESHAEQLTRVAKFGVVETLARSLTHPSMQVRIRLCRILAVRPTPRTFEALTDLAQKDSEWAVRLEALTTLIKLADERTSVLVGHALETEEEMVQEKLLQVLRDAPQNFLAQLSVTICHTLQTGNLAIRREAVFVLEKIQNDITVPSLLACLADSAAEVRRIAASALRHSIQKEEVVDRLISLLEDPEESVREAVMQTLTTSDNPKVVEPLVDALGSASVGMVDQIAHALADHHRDDAVAILDLLMGRAEPRMRLGMAKTLEYIQEDRVVPFLITFLRDGDPGVRKTGVRALGKFRDLADREPLIECLSDPNAEVREAAIISLVQLEEFTVLPALLEQLDREPDERVARWIVVALGGLVQGNGDSLRPSVIQKIRSWLEFHTENADQSAGWLALSLSRDESIFTTTIRGIQNSLVHTQMVAYLRELPGDSQKRFFAFLSLEANLFWQPHSEENKVHYLNVLQSSRKVGDRVHAIEALTALEVREAVPAMESAFAKDPSPHVRATAFSALGKFLHGEGLVTHIGRAVLDPAELVKSKVIPMLQMVSGHELRGAREKLVPLLDTEREDIRNATSELLARLYHEDWESLTDELMGTERRSRIQGLLRTLGLLRDPKTSPFFLQFMKHEDPEVRSAASDGAYLSSILSPEEWLPFLEDPQENVRLSALRGLGQSMSSVLLGKMAPHVEDPSNQIRRELAFLLGKQTLHDDGRPIELLHRLQLDENPGVRLASAFSLFRLGQPNTGIAVRNVMAQLEREDKKSVLDTLRRQGVMEELLQTLRLGRNPTQRKDAVTWLALLDLPSFENDIVLSLQDPSPDVRVSAIEILGVLESPKIQNAILTLAEDPVEAVRIAVKRRRMRLAK